MKIEIYEKDFKNYKDILLYINQEILKAKTDDVDTIVTNLAMGSILSDLTQMKLEPLKAVSLELTTGPYLIGEYLQMKVYIDPYMRWNDKTLYLKSGDVVCETLEFIDNDGILI
jgi:hypothetical protein